MKEALAVTSLVVSVLSNVPYIKETIQGRVRPERISWLLWALLGGIYYASAVFEDGAKLFAFGELIGPAIILILSLRYGVGGRSWFSFISLIVAVAAFALLFILEGVLISLVLALIVDGVGALLTIRKLYVDSSSESRVSWGLSAIASALALLALTAFTIETILFPVYILLLSSFIFLRATSVKSRKVLQLEKL